MIELRKVTKRFGTKCAVDGLDLEVRPGELFAFLGPNGAGKTTTIKMICGLLAPSSGIVRVGGFESTSLQARQLLGYVPDQPYLYDKLTGREFLKFVVEMYGLERPHAARRIHELIDTFEMGDYVDELCETYSQGMKQRVVFASALVHDPKILVVDEPLVGLDPRSARIVKDLFVAQARSGCAVLMSTHLLAIAEELADRIGIVDRGKMLALGTLDELRRQMQHHGPLEDLFLKLTGDMLPTANVHAIPGSVPESRSQPTGSNP
jgi:ABC-2 type transport system ATP-binding protein